MRALVAALLLASCATPVPPPPDRLAGCWIDRRADNTATTMRWLADPENAGGFRGERLAYTPTGAGDRSSYTLRPDGASWTLCQVVEPTPRCFQVAEGESGSLEGGRAFIDAAHNRLRISIFNDGVERIIFQGDRDGCD